MSYSGSVVVHLVCCVVGLRTKIAAVMTIRFTTATIVSTSAVIPRLADITSATSSQSFWHGYLLLVGVFDLCS